VVSFAKQWSVGVEITFYTDPLCCWSWAMDPPFRKLEENFGNSLSTTYKMAGLLPSWDNFADTVNSIRKPAQMGPEWMHVKEITGAEIDPGIWVSDPPASSFPACIAVKSAELQSRQAGERYLHLLREAVMVRRINIARTETLLEIGRSLSDQLPAFNPFTFQEDLLGSRGREAFRLDWQEMKYNGIVRIPTLIFRSASRATILLSGYQSYEALENAVTAMQKKA
jgi:putative protein-disulfide isomerase